MKRISLILLGLLFAGAVYADATPFVYSRTILKIVPHAATPAKPAESKDAKENGNKPTEVLPNLPRVAKEFTVDVRTPQFLAQRDFIYLQPFTDAGGMIILIDPPQMTSLQPANLLAKVDVLFLAEDGLVLKIAPELTLNRLAEPIPSEQPVRAFLFLKAGMAKLHDIKPGDVVENALFKTHPVVMDAPAASDAAKPEQPK